MNSCTFIGRFVRDPECMIVGNNVKCLNFQLAIHNKTKNSTTGEWEDGADFLSFKAWGSGAETIEKHFKQGNAIIVECEAKQETWTNKETDTKHSKIVFRVNKFHFVPKNKQNEKE